MRAPPLLAGLLLATAGAAYALGTAEAGAGPRGPLAAEVEDDAVPPEALPPAEAPPALRAGAPRSARPSAADVGTAPPPPSGTAPTPVEPKPSRRVLVTVEVVDATTGRVVPGARWTSRALPKPPAPPAGGLATTDPSAEPIGRVLEAGEARAEVESVPPSFERGASAVLAPEGADVSDLRLDLCHVPAGWCDVGLDAGDLRVSRYAASVLVVWPVVPEADVVVEFTVGGASPPAWMGFGSVSVSATVAGERVSASAEPVVGGVRVHGVPVLRGASVELAASVWGEDGGRQGSAEGVLGTDGSRPQRFTIDLPEAASDELSFSGCWRCGGCRCGGAVRRLRRWTGATGSVVATVTRRDGRPAVDAFVVAVPVGAEAEERRGAWSARVGADGMWRLDGLPVGAYALRLNEAGLVWSETPFDVVADAPASVALREAAAASIDVLVVHEDGAPAAGAVLEVTPSAGTWVELGDDDVQRVAPHTGADGRRPVTGLPAGATTVRATYAGRRAEATVDVATGATERLTLTVSAK
ncbi:MAG: hypothetical protein U1E39_12580 [Planctomycetota bacterium]